jgi:hypothetical protein
MSEEADMILPPKPKLSKLAALALLSSVPCIAAVGVVYDLLPSRHAFVLPYLWLVDLAGGILWGAQISRSAGLTESLVLPALILLTVSPAIVLGIVGAAHIDRSHGRLKGVSLAMAAVGIGMCSSLLTSPLILRDLEKTREAFRLVRIQGTDQCRESILAIGVATKRYVDFHEGNIPEASQWCDMLIRGHYLDRQKELLWLARKRRWPCAINRKCGPQSPGETVLLFESRLGWNLRGGLESFVHRHETAKGAGGYIFCKNGELKFVTDATQLVWE